MSAKLTLTKQTVVDLFQTGREAERSIDAVLQDRWERLQDYYQPAKRGHLRELSHDLRKQLTVDLQPPSREELFDLQHAHRLFWVLVRWFDPWRTHWSISAIEAAFITTTFDRVLSLLEEVNRPDPERLIQMRMDLHACNYTLESHAGGLPEIKNHRRFDHFNSPWQKPAPVLAPAGR